MIVVRHVGHHVIAAVMTGNNFRLVLGGDLVAWLVDLLDYYYYYAAGCYMMTVASIEW